MATTTTPIPPAQKAATIAHMNKDHRRDMRHILHHYPSVPPVPSITRGDEEQEKNDPLMHDITLSSITLHLPLSNTFHTIAFDPPLQHWDERRTRLVEMTRVARAAALGVVDEVTVVVVGEYMPPRVPYDAGIFLAVLGYWVSFGLVRMGWFGSSSSSLLAEVVEWSRFPGGAEGFAWLVEAIFWPVLAIHVAETWWLERSRLGRFGVRRGSRVWWLWVGSVFVEGAMAFKRFDLVVERLRGEKAGKRQ
ncbi:hypothetical protein C8A00DRAFT_15837 [Chaetomidium leptoderma]|uniref:DUF2470 domain-containing protein n=1 Tax=Chaetomidium leptoderma TaxID=669021 RepID=A0AAN6ZWH9_9PEZI|nr:hypothetical protein C8A00DRAFT_15837 [Chaetomidium leptoderma]